MLRHCTGGDFILRVLPRRPKSLVAANTKQAQDRLDELLGRLEGRKLDLEKERNCTIGDIQRHASAWVLPHPDRATRGLAAMVRDDEIEHLAVEAVIAFERARGCEVESVEKDIGDLLNAVTPDECSNFFASCGHVNT